MDFSFIESNPRTTTFPCGLDHLKVYDPSSPDQPADVDDDDEWASDIDDDDGWASEVDDSGDGFARNMGIDKQEETWYAKFLEEQEAANREFLAELRNSPGLREFVFGPDVDDPWPDMLDLLKPKPEDDPDDFEGDSFARDMGADRAEEVLYDECLERQVLEDEEFARKYGSECPDYDPSLDDGLWPDEMSPALAS